MSTTAAAARITGIHTIGVPDSDEAHRALRSHGVAVGEVLRWPGVPAMFAFRDLDGNGYELVEQR
jgi:lactoylglutathione lyase